MQVGIDLPMEVTLISSVHVIVVEEQADNSVCQDCGNSANKLPSGSIDSGIGQHWGPINTT